MRKEIPRSPRTLAKKQAGNQSPQATRSDIVLKYAPLAISSVGLLISVAAFLSSFAQNGPTIIKNTAQAVDWYQTDQEFSGFWTNNGEGNIEAEEWTTDSDNAVSFNLTVKSGVVSGEVISNRFCKFDPYNTLQVEGRASGNHITAILWDYVGGKRRGFAKVKLQIDRDHNVTVVKTEDQLPNMLPLSFTVGKWEEQSPFVKSDLCFNLQKNSLSH
jgi:hypothetical protein